MKAPSLAEIKAANASLNDGFFALIRLSRPFGPYLAWAAIRLGLTPRQVNYFSLALAGGLLVLVATGGSQGRIVGIALVFLWQIVDVTDGTMARALKIRDNFGGFVDFATGMLVATFLPLCLGVGVTLAPEGSLALLLPRFGLAAPAHAAFVFIAAAGISLISLYVRLLSRVLITRFGEAVDGLKAARDGGANQGLLRSVARNLETLGGMQAFVFFGGAILGQLEVVLVGYAFFYVAILLAFGVSTHRNYRARTQYLGESSENLKTA